MPTDKSASPERVWRHPVTRIVYDYPEPGCEPYIHAKNREALLRALKPLLEPCPWLWCSRRDGKTYKHAADCPVEAVLDLAMSEAPSGSRVGPESTGGAVRTQRDDRQPDEPAAPSPCCVYPIPTFTGADRRKCADCGEVLES